MACDNGSCGDKDVTHCPACGKAVPPALGLKPRKYCSKACCRLILRPRNPGAEKCADCQRPIRQPPGKGRKRVICPDCRLARKKRCTRQGSCGRCGRDFLADRDEAVFCSTKCRWPNRRFSTKATCRCGVEFAKRTDRTKYCSRSCAAKYADKQKPSKVYLCVNCGAPFGSRAYRTSNKYCSRECAFQSRRLRAAGVVGDPLSAWFHAWGDESRGAFRPKPMGTSHKARCDKFGVPYERVDRTTVLERDGWACYLCGRGLLRRYTKGECGKVDRASPTIDCVVPLSAGPGSPGYTYENVRACCLGCNVAKSATPLHSFVSQYTTSLD